MGALALYNGLWLRLRIARREMTRLDKKILREIKGCEKCGSKR